MSAVEFYINVVIGLAALVRGSRFGLGSRHERRGVVKCSGCG